MYNIKNEINKMLSSIKQILSNSRGKIIKSDITLLYILN